MNITLVKLYETSSTNETGGSTGNGKFFDNKEDALLSGLSTGYANEVITHDAIKVCEYCYGSPEERFYLLKSPISLTPLPEKAAKKKAALAKLTPEDRKALGV